MVVTVRVIPLSYHLRNPLQVLLVPMTSGTVLVQISMSAYCRDACGRQTAVDIMMVTLDDSRRFAFCFLIITWTLLVSKGWSLIMIGLRSGNRCV